MGRQIAVKELLPVIIAAAIWGPEWAGKWIVLNCDNQAVVAVINSRYSREKDLMQLLHYLFFLEAHFQFQLSAYHLPGVLNDCADDLSRNPLPSFQAKTPTADTYSSFIPLLSSTVATASRPQLDISNLDPAVQFFCKKGIANSTHKTYQSALRRFGTFCSRYGIYHHFHCWKLCFAILLPQWHVSI